MMINKNKFISILAAITLVLTFFSCKNNQNCKGEWVSKNQINDSFAENFFFANKCDTIKTRTQIWKYDTILFEQTIHINDSTNYITEYYDKGNPRVTYQTINDIDVGKMTVFDEDGNLKQIQIRNEEGDLIDYFNFDKGKPVKKPKLLNINNPNSSMLDVGYNKIKVTNHNQDSTFFQIGVKKKGEYDFDSLIYSQGNKDHFYEFNLKSHRENLNNLDVIVSFFKKGKLSGKVHYRVPVQIPN